MNVRALASPLFAAPLLLSTACTEATGDGTGGGTQAGDPNELLVDVPADGKALVRLATPEVVALPDDGASSTDWDLALSGYDVFTNSGSSGPGEAGGFPLDVTSYETGEVPGIPFLIQDEPGGAFVKWYAYDPAEHVIYSRFHVFGVKEGDRYWKIQVFGFYGEVDGAPVPGLYSLQYAEVTEGGAGATVELTDVDATAGGNEAPPTAPSACLDLSSGAILMLLPDEAAASTEWDLCFRRAAISVNGELGGPGAVAAADLQAEATASEQLQTVKTLTPESEAQRFDSVGWAELTDAAVPYRGDRILSAFSDKWVVVGSDPPVPAELSWLIQSADGLHRFVAVFDRFEGPTAETPGRVAMKIKQVE